MLYLYAFVADMTNMLCVEPNHINVHIMRVISHVLCGYREAMVDLNSLIVEQREPLENVQTMSESSNATTTKGIEELKKV